MFVFKALSFLANSQLSPFDSVTLMKLQLKPPNQLCIESLRNGLLPCIIDWDHISYDGQVVRPYRGLCHFAFELTIWVKGTRHY